MRSLTILAAALTASATLAAPAQLSARDGGPYYRAELAAPAPDSQLIAKGTLWRCEGTLCAAPKSRSRDVVACKRLVKEAGAVVSFSAGGQALDAAELADCNS